MRYEIPDNLRGLNLISMIAYHGIWDLVYLLGHSIPWYEGTAGYLWQQSICCTFILLSGFCWSLGKRPLYRGIQVFAAGILITAVTMAFLPEERILFGVLTLLGSCMLLLIPLEKILKRIEPKAGAAASLLLFLLLNQACYGWISLGKFQILQLPASLYRNLFTAYLGFPPPEFSSSDYFPLLPWIFLYAAGYFLYRWMKRKDLLFLLSTNRKSPLGFLGRHCLEIYLLHQPVLYLGLLLPRAIL